MQAKQNLALLLAGVCLLAGGCTKDNSREDGASADEKATDSRIPVVTTVTEATVPVRDRTAIDTETQHIVDDAKLFSRETYDAVNQYAAWLSKTLCLRVCVVTADDLEGKKPEAYAADYYSFLYSPKESGCLLLLNNESGQDCIFTAGTCGNFFQKAERDATLAGISKLLAEKKYEVAITHVFEQLELHCPEHIFDLQGGLNIETMTAIEQLGDKAAAGRDFGIAIFLADEATPEQAETLRQRAYDDRDSIVLVISRSAAQRENGTGGAIATALGGSLQESVSNTALGAALDKTDAALQSTSLSAAAERFFEAAAGFCGVA